MEQFIGFLAAFPFAFNGFFMIISKYMLIPLFVMLPAMKELSNIEFNWNYFIFLYLLSFVTFKFSSVDMEAGIFNDILLLIFVVTYFPLLWLAFSLPVKIFELAISIIEFTLHNILAPFGKFLLETLLSAIKSLFSKSSNSNFSTVHQVKHTIPNTPKKQFGTPSSVVSTKPNKQFSPSSSNTTVINSNYSSHNSSNHSKTTSVLEYYGKNNRKFQIDKKPLAEGGEAIIYRVSVRRVAKIFHDGHATSDKEKKLNKLLKSNLPNNVLKPTELLYDKDGKFVGYIMSFANGVELGELFLPNGLNNTFPQYNLIDLTQLCLTIIQAYQSIHQESIICGDISFRNILVNSKNKVYILDVDSFQIGSPSPAGLDTYTRTCNQGKSFKGYMRNIEDDSYAITMLVFQILHYGYLPYGGDDVKSIKDGICLFNPEMTSHPEVKQEIVDCYCDLSMELQVYFHEVFGLKKYRTLEQLFSHLVAYKKMLQN